MYRRNKYNMRVRLLLLGFVCIVSLVEKSEAANKCYLAKICIHNGREKCGQSKTGKVRRFLDTCDIKEYNCLHNTNYLKTDPKKCRNLPGIPEESSKEGKLKGDKIKHEATTKYDSKGDNDDDANLSINKNKVDRTSEEDDRSKGENNGNKFYKGVTKVFDSNEIDVGDVNNGSREENYRVKKVCNQDKVNLTDKENEDDEVIKNNEDTEANIEDGPERLSYQGKDDEKVNLTDDKNENDRLDEDYEYARASNEDGAEKLSYRDNDTDEVNSTNEENKDDKIDEDIEDSRLNNEQVEKLINYQNKDSGNVNLNDRYDEDDANKSQSGNDVYQSNEADIVEGARKHIKEKRTQKKVKPRKHKNNSYYILHRSRTRLGLACLGPWTLNGIFALILLT